MTGSFEHLGVSVKENSVKMTFQKRTQLIEGWKELFKFTETSFMGMFHNENMSSINLFQPRGLRGQAKVCHKNESDYSDFFFFPRS